MSDIYHELLNSAEYPLAILQESSFLLLDHNDKFATLCAVKPFQGGSLPLFGFPASINEQLASKILHFKSGDSVNGRVWMPMTIAVEPSIDVQVQIKYYEASTGHLLVAVVAD